MAVKIHRTHRSRVIRLRPVPLPDAYSMGHLRALLRDAHALRSLRAKLPRDPVAWQRRIRKDWDRSRKLERTWRRLRSLR